jgi:hypothetical protein
MDMKKQAGYYSFLLRLWQVKEDGGQEWRATLENVESGEKRGFTNVEDLLAYLSQVTAKKYETADKGSLAEVQG